MENKSELIFSVLQGIGLLAILLFCITGLSYIYNGNLIYSITISVIVVLLFGGLVYFMTTKKYDDVNKGFTLIEGICLVLYLGVAFYAFSLMAHSVNIEIVLKDDLKAEASNKLNSLVEMIEQYDNNVQEAVRLMDIDLENTISRREVINTRNKFAAYGQEYDGNSDPNVLKTSTVNSHSNRANLGVEEIKQKNEVFIANEDKIFKKWKRGEIQRSFWRIDQRLKENFEQLHNQFKSDNAPSWNDGNDFEFDVPLAQGNVLSKPYELMDKYQTGWVIPILVTLLLHFFILSPYLFKSREGGYIPDKPDSPEMDF